VKIFSSLFSAFICFFSISTFAQSIDNDYHTGQLYVRLNSQIEAPTSLIPSEKAKSFFESFNHEYDISKVVAGFYFVKGELANTYHVYFRNFQKTQEFIEALESRTEVEYAERIPISRKYDIPNDLGTNSQGNNGQYYLYKIGAPLAWDIQQGNPNIKVGVVDDALESTHEDLSGFILNGYDAVNQDFDLTPPGNDWDHGTFISGMIAAKTNNGIGMASLARGVRILPVKITDDFNANIIQNEYEGVVYAASQGVDVINMSWGSSIPNQTGLAAINSVNNAGIVLVAAAGNDNSSLVTYPAAYPNVISVAATTSIDTKASFSNFGSWIDISAPGSQIWSLLPNNSYGVKSGTSFAAPLVSAAAALLLSNNPSLTPAQVLSCLKSSADNIDVFNSNYAGLLGAGRLNVRQALQCVLSSESAYDVWLTEVITPALTSCNNEIEPQIRVINFGIDTIFSMTIRWQIDNGFALDFPWSDTLLPGDARIITLPSSLLPIGTHQLNITILDVLNDLFLDAYPSNNTANYSFYINPSTGFSLPFVETFESGTFATQNWTVVDPGSDFSWEIATSSGTLPGSKSARLPYFIDFETGVRDFLISPTLNFSGFSNVTLSFNYAYMERTAGVTDSLIVSVSSDCGQTWNQMWARGEGVNAFATAISSGAFFTPTLPNDWCGIGMNPSCGQIDLSGFDGLTGVRIRFEGLNGNGNNIYLDNINISGSPLNQPPIAGFDAIGSLEVCIGEPVVINNTSQNAPASSTWFFPGANIENSSAAYPTAVYSQAGQYAIRLIATNPFGEDTLLINDYITVIDVPNVQVIFEPDTICRGQSATLTATGADLYYWNAAPSLPATYGNSVSVNPLSTTTFTVTGWQESTCTSSISSTLVVVNPPAAPTITYVDAVLSSSSASSFQWYVNGVEIEGATNQTYVPAANGNYNVRAYDAIGCSSISIPFMILDVGIETLEKVGFALYPNPAGNVVQLKSTEPIIRTQIYDMNGKLIQETNHNGNNKSIELDTSAISNGYYFIGLSSQSIHKVLPLIVQH